MKTVTPTTNGLVDKNIFVKSQQYSNDYASGNVCKIPKSKMVTIDIFYVTNSYGNARFILYSGDDGAKCVKLFGAASSYVIDYTKFYYDADGNYYVQAPASTAMAVKVVGGNLYASITTMSIDTSELTEIQQTA